MFTFNLVITSASTTGITEALREALARVEDGSYVQGSDSNEVADFHYSCTGEAAPFCICNSDEEYTSYHETREAAEKQMQVGDSLMEYNHQDDAYTRVYTLTHRFGNK